MSASSTRLGQHDGGLHKRPRSPDHVLPDNDDWPIQRSKASTPPSADQSLARGSLHGSRDNEEDTADGSHRGRTILRTTSSTSERHKERSVSPEQRYRRRTISVRPPPLDPTKTDACVLADKPEPAKPRDDELDNQFMEPSPTWERVPSAFAHRVDSEEPSPVSSTSTGDPLEPRVHEPPPAAQVPVTVTERVEDDSLPRSLSRRKAPPSLKFLEATRPGWGFEDLVSGRNAGPTPLPSPGLSQHRDTFEVLQRKTRARTRIHPRGPSISRGGFEDLPFPALLKLASLLDHRSFLAARLTCQSWCIAFSHVRPLHFPALYRLPPELVQAVLRCVESPRDFDAARHTCRAWMVASLDPKLLSWMIRKGGWWASWAAEKERSMLASGDGKQDEIWSMSRALARECAFASVARTDRNGSVSSPVARFQLDGTVDEDYDEARTTPFELVLEADCSALSDLYTSVFSEGMWRRVSPQSLYGLHFTPSVCGRFVLAYHGYQIFIYRLGQRCRPHLGTSAAGFPEGQRLETNPKMLREQAAISTVSSIICPRRVLAVSMDTSSGRHAVAALLEDRVGLVCDLQSPCLASDGNRPWSAAAELAAPEPEGLEAEHVHWCPYPFGSSLPFVRATEHIQFAPTRIIFGDDSPALHIGLGSEASYYRSIRAFSIYHPSNASTECVPIDRETGSRSVFRGLGAADDPPLSVAICPQRRCVAFGCAAGIELHWTDALTGHSLNRWFPLAAPSDYLYFLPLRRGLDSAKKLRLVSSTAPPSRKIAIDPSPAVATGGAPESRDDRIRANADTIRAVPLTDGVHVAFTDPVSRRLFLGSDALAGAPARLSRKIVLEGPPNVRPTTYAVGRDLSWGARVAAAYGDEVWLFSVPADILRCEGEGSDEPWVSTYAVAQAPSAHPITQGRSNGLAWAHGAPENEGASTAIWPVHIYGMCIAVVPRLAELAVDSRLASLTVWAFAHDGMARAWQVRGAYPREKRVGFLHSEGSLGDMAAEAGPVLTPHSWGRSGPQRFDILDVDADGDSVMHDAPSPWTDTLEPSLCPGFRGQVQFDGASSPPTAHSSDLGSPASSTSGGVAPQDIGLDGGCTDTPSPSPKSLHSDATRSLGEMRVLDETSPGTFARPGHRCAGSPPFNPHVRDARVVTRGAAGGCMTAMATHTLPRHVYPCASVQSATGASREAEAADWSLEASRRTEPMHGLGPHASSSGRSSRFRRNGVIIETASVDGGWGALEVTEDPGMLVIEIVAA